jgi:predicted esterase YcpF (UPF0227 family)
MAKRIQRDFPSVHWWCPQLPASPRQAIALIESQCANWPSHTSAVVGSSLGGFYATWVTQHLGWPAVLINPAVYPARDLAAYIGVHPCWHNPQDTLFFQPHYVDELQALDSGPLQHPERIMAWIAKGDEVLDWREMLQRYAQCQTHVLEGGDHALSDFESHLDPIVSFLNLA